MDRWLNIYGFPQESLPVSCGSFLQRRRAEQQHPQKGWIRETISDHPEDKRKRLYELTDFGREILIREVQRIRHLSDTADSIMKGDNG